MKRTLQLVCLLSGGLVFGAIASVDGASAGDWPQWRGPDRDGHAADDERMRSDWGRPPQLLWKIEGVGRGYASCSVVGDRLYTTGNTNGRQALVCVDLEKQKVLWSTGMTDGVPEHGYPGSRSTPTVSDGLVYAVGSDGSIVCCDAETGEKRWMHPFSKWDGRMSSGWGFSESPLVDGDRVVFTPGGSKGGIVACDKQTGDVLWTANIEAGGDKGKDGAGYSSLVRSDAAGVPQYVTLTGRGAVSVSAESGKELWRYNRVANGVADIPTPVVWDNYVFVSSGYGDGGSALLKLSASGDGVAAEEVYWKSNGELQNHHGGVIKDGPYLYMGNKHGKGFPVCVEAETGEFAWGGSIRGEGKGSAAISAADGQLIFRYQNGVVAFLKLTPDEYQVLGTFVPEYQEENSWSHPVVAGGVMYLREQNVLMAYDVSAK